MATRTLLAVTVGLLVLGTTAAGGDEEPAAEPPELPEFELPKPEPPDIEVPPVLRSPPRLFPYEERLLHRRHSPNDPDAAVFTGLRWLRQHQRPDGSWSFDNVGRRAEAGTVKDCPTGATGLALLVFLGAGQTHLAGDYRQPVYDGLMYLLKQIDPENDAADLGTGEGRMRSFSHAVVTLALSEAYRLTTDDEPEGDLGQSEQDRARTKRLFAQLNARLKLAAQLGVNFVLKQQVATGGWRSQSNCALDVEATALAVLVLHSGRSAGLRVPAPQFRKANEFLDTLAIDEGRRYRRSQNGEASPSTTAAGLLCRTLLTPEHPGIAAGVEGVVKAGPSLEDPLGQLYGTLLLHLHGGAGWETWNRKFRTQILTAQRRTGAATGSWPAGGPAAKPGGDLMQTCLSILALEVYYRHLPVFRRLKP